ILSRGRPSFNALSRHGGSPGRRPLPVVYSAGTTGEWPGTLAGGLLGAQAMTAPSLRAPGPPERHTSAPADARPGLAPGPPAARGLDIGACLVLLAVAAAIRLPYLLDVPVITNETEEIARALQVARGQILPLVNVSDFLGAWNNYL